MNAVMISIRPKWCGMILEGEKTIEIRKNLPSILPPFKCYIYCTIGGDPLYLVNGNPMLNKVILPHNQHSTVWEMNGCVIAEFICEKIVQIPVFFNGAIQNYHANRIDLSCVPYDEIADYIGYGEKGYGWHISNLKVYEKPKKLCEFFYPCEKQKYPYCFDCEHGLQKGEERPIEGMRYYDVACGNWLKRPPQSWCYVEELR